MESREKENGASNRRIGVTGGYAREEEGTGFNRSTGSSGKVSKAAIIVFETFIGVSRSAGRKSRLGRIKVSLV